MWQALADRHRPSRLLVCPIALDALPERVIAATQSLHLRLRLLIDDSDEFGRLYGFSFVPAAFLIDEGGSLAFEYRPSFDPLTDFGEADGALLAKIERAVQRPPLGSSAGTRRMSVPTPGLEAFERGVRLFRGGQRAQAVACWRAAATLEPDNLVWRNHLWRALYPERFAAGDIDLPWQEQQFAREREAGIEAANPIPAQIPA